MPCAVKKTFEADRHSGNAVLAQVKGNQLNLLETVRDIASQQSPLDGCRTVDRKRHGRQEHRMLKSSTSPDMSTGIGMAARHRRTHHLHDLAQGHQIRPLACRRRDILLRLTGQAGGS